MRVDIKDGYYGFGIFDSGKTFPNQTLTKRHVVANYEIEFYTEPCGTTYINDSPCKIRPGRVLCIKPGTERYSELPLRSHYLKVTPTGSETDKILDGILDRFMSVRIERYTDIIHQMLAAESRGDSLLCHAKYLEIIALLAEESKRQEKIRMLDGNGRDAVSRGLDYIEAHYSGKCTLRDIAAHAHFSSVYFHGIFKKAIGKTPNEYLAEYRIERAKEMLLIEDMDIARIAVAAGFSSQSYFNYAFKNAVGQTPREYRERSLEKYFSYDGKIH
jgi:AraC-like DNA-binding protein